MVSFREQATSLISLLCFLVLLAGLLIPNVGATAAQPSRMDDPITPWVRITNRTELHIAFQINGRNQPRLRPNQQRDIYIGNRTGFTLRYHNGRQWLNPEDYYGNGNTYSFHREFSDINTGATLTVTFLQD
jgi:hypothetical protein